MMMKGLIDLLESNGVEYAMLHHKTDYRARETASDTHTVSTAKLADTLDANGVRLATEPEMKELCPDAEVEVFMSVGGGCRGKNH